MKKIFSLRKNRGPVSVILSVVLSVFFVVAIVEAATTISTNINTGGTLTVTGVGHFTDDININGGDINLGSGSATSTLTSVAGKLGIASSTPFGVFSVSATSTATLSSMPVFVVSTSTATATTTAFIIDSNGKVGIGTTSPYAQVSTVGVVAGTAFHANDSTATSTFQGGVILNSKGGAVGIASSTPFVALGITGTTTSSAGAILGLNGAPINQIRFGTCTYNPGAGIAASSTVSTNCTGATGVVTSDNVFVTPVNLEAGLVFVAASSTAADVIQVSVFNTGWRNGGLANGVSVTPVSRSWFWIAIR